MSNLIRVGTRGSALALWQANETSRLLREAGYEPEIVTIRTTGDRRQDVSLATIGGKGLFIKELEEALDQKEIDVAVHSLKDVPSLIDQRFVLAGFLERADPRDVWVHPAGDSLGSLAPGTTIGTSAPRRRAQLRALRPDLRIADIRGNVDTRIRKARDGQYAGIVLAGAGMTRLGRTTEITSWFEVDAMVPAAGQGIIGIECRTEDARAIEAAHAITHAASATAAAVERGVLQQFGEQLDCYSAVAVHCTDDLEVRAFFSDPAGMRSIRVQHDASGIEDAIKVVYERLITEGAKELLAG